MSESTGAPGDDLPVIADESRDAAQESQPDPIEGYVARVLNSRELVINRGSKHGVEVGMYFDVLAPEAEDIRDPVTDEPLGNVDRPKVAVKVVQVQEKLSVARTFRSRRRNVGGLGALAALDQLFGPPKYETEYDTFKASGKTWENLDEAESFVQTGDPVRQSFRYND